MSTKKILKPVFSSEQDMFDGMKDNNEMISREEVPNTPFMVIGTEKGFFGCVGRYRITELKETQREVIEELDVEPNWDRIVQIVLILIDNFKTEKA